MKALTITNESVTREDLLELAHRIPGAWVGIRIAAVLFFGRDGKQQELLNYLIYHGGAW